MKALKISLCVLLGILVSISIVVVIFVNSPFNQLRSQDGMLFRYRADKGGYVLLQYTGEASEVIVPDTVSGKPVVGIGADAFQKNKSIKRLTIPNSVAYMYPRCLSGCDGLTYLSVPFIGLKAGVEEEEWLGSIFGIPQESQEYWNYLPSNLKTVVVTGRENYIPDRAFAFCYSIENIILGEKISLIGDEAFWRCSSLRSCTLPSIVTKIGDRAFYSCRALEEITLPSGVKLIGEEAFGSCHGLCKVDFLCTDAFICKGTFSYCSSLSEVNLADGITAIAEGMFEGCIGLKNISLPASVTHIYRAAFYYCESLKSLEIPAGVISIGDKAFANCAVLCEATIPASVTEFGLDIWIDCRQLEKVTVLAPEVPAGAFWGDTNLRTVVLSTAVESIGNIAFQNCSTLKKLYCMGTPTDWQERQDIFDGDGLESVTVLYYSEEAPTDTAHNYWHYVNGVPTPW